MKKIALSLFLLIAVFFRLNAQQIHTFTGGVDTAWVRHYRPGSPFLNNFATAMAFDSSGNVFVTGRSGSDIATIKYNSTGDMIWENRFNKPGSIHSKPSAIVVDKNGDVIVTGYVDGVQSLIDFIGVFGGDYVTIKYHSSGDSLWTKFFNGPDNTYDEATALTVDANHNIYVTGVVNQDWFIDTGSRDSVELGFGNFCTIKYSSSGDVAWAKHFGESNDYKYSDVPIAIDVDANANVYVAGTYIDNIVALKYSLDGDTMWVRQHQGWISSAKSLIVDMSGNVFVTGVQTYDTYVTIKHDSQGNVKWAKTFPGNANDLAIDSIGNVYVIGSSADHYATIKYNPSGDTEWVREYPGRDSGWGQRYDPSFVAVDADGNVNITMRSDSSIMTVRYDNNGSKLWSAKYSFNPSSLISPCDIQLDLDGNIYVVGTTTLEGESFYTVIKYIQNLTSVKESQNVLPIEFILNQNYANPFNPTTQISFQLPLASRVSLKVFDLLGREVALLVNEEKAPGAYTVTWDAVNVPSGVYFYRFTAGDFTQVRKAVLLR